MVSSLEKQNVNWNSRNLNYTYKHLDTKEMFSSKEKHGLIAHVLVAFFNITILAKLHEHHGLHTFGRWEVVCESELQLDHADPKTSMVT